MELEDVIEEYLYHCMAKGFTPKTMKNKRQEMKQLRKFLMDEKDKRVRSHQYITFKAIRQSKAWEGLQPQSIVSMFKMVRAFFSWCQKEEYLKENIAKR